MLSKILFIKKFIDHHPIASKAKWRCYGRVLYWQLIQAINPRLVKMKFVENSNLMMKKGLAGATSHIYAGLGEYEEMSLVLHLLRPGDLMGDVGANIGAFSVLAAANVGADAISIEPIPDTYSILQSNVESNKAQQKITTLQYGVGDKEGVLRFTSALDAMNHVLLDNEESSDAIEIKVLTLDTIFANRTPTMMKIDVEGYEYPALLGAQKILSDPALQAIIIELNGCGKNFGYDENAVHQMLLDKGFSRMHYHPTERSFTEDHEGKNDNKIYIRDRSWANERVATARKYKILNSRI